MTTRTTLGVLFGTALLAGLGVAGSAWADPFFDQGEYDRQMKLLDATPVGPQGQPWAQAVDPSYVDTAQFKKSGPATVCFSNAGVFNPWRVVGFKSMQAEVETHPGLKFVVTDAENKDDKQIADISDLLARGDCSVLIVSPNTTEALTPAVEAACKKLPVIVFDRGVNTRCPVTFINPIGGYAFGAQAARFIVKSVPKGASVLALRIMPGVDVLENRWSAAARVFQDAGLKVLGVEFHKDDRATAKNIVSDYLQRYGKIDAVWMDAGATSEAVIEAFEDAGVPVPVITGEDQEDFLVKWQKDKLTAIAPTYPTFQWRTPIIAALKILDGEKVPGPVWKLPQPTITNADLAQYVDAAMPPQHYALCGCKDLPGYPERWGGHK
jgi:ribose transport system substrate-binding protein